MNVTPYDPLFAAAGTASNVDPNLLAAQAAVESGFDPTATSKAGAGGLMQIMPETAKGLGVANPYDPEQAVNGGAKLMDQLLNQFGNVPDALRGYNAGPDRSRWGNSETQAYVGKVQAAYQDILRAGGIKVAQADTGNATDAGSAPGSAPIHGRPSDDQMMQMLTGGSSSSPPPASSPAAASLPQVAPVPGRPDDATMMQMLTGSGSPPPAAAGSSGAPAATLAPPQTPPTSIPPGAPSAAPPATFASVPPHPAPDGSGVTTNLSDADYYRFKLQQAAQPGAPDDASAPIAVSGATPDPAAAGGPNPTPISSPGGATIPTWMQAAGAGAADAYRGTARTLANVANYVDNNVPFLKSLDSSVGLHPDQVSNDLMATIQGNQQQFGSNPLYLAGNVGGNIAQAIPMMAAGGAGVGAVLDALPGVGRVAGAVANGVRAIPGGNALVALGTNAAKGAAQGAGVAAATSGGSNAPIGQQIQTGAELGGVLGGAVPAVIGAGKGIVNTALGGSTDAETAALAAKAKQLGIPITLGQLSTNPAVRTVDAVTKQVPFSGATAESATQQAAFNKAVSNQIGEDTTTVTPQVMTNAKLRIGGVLDHVENNNDVNFDPQFVQDLSGIEAKAQSSLTDPEYAVVQRQLAGVMKNVQPGDTITGQTFGNLIHKGSTLDAAINSRDSNVANFAGQIKGALQDALSRSLSPPDAQAYSQARLQYKNLKTIEPLVSSATGGDISPARLASAVGKTYGSSTAYAGGGGDIVDLARIGQRFLKEPPDSGTANRVATLDAITRAGGIVGGVITGAANPVDAAYLAAAAGGTALAARGARAYLGSQLLANRLVQAGLNPAAAPGVVNRLMATYADNAGGLGVAAAKKDRLPSP
jgi:hypothetical protein